MNFAIILNIWVEIGLISIAFGLILLSIFSFITDFLEDGDVYEVVIFSVCAVAMIIIAVMYTP